MSKREEVGEMATNIFVFFLERQKYLKNSHWLQPSHSPVKHVQKTK